MKTLAFLAIATLFVGCTATTTTTTTSNTAPQRDYLANKRVHTHEDLQKTGQPELGGALQTVDPSVYISSSGR